MKCRYDSHQYLKLFVICFLVFLAILSIWHNTDAYASDTSKILISEICAKNTTISTSDGQYYDWIELYNDNDEDVDLYGFGISDDIDSLYLFTFKEHTIIPKHGFLVIFCDKKASKSNENIAGFGLSTDAETIFLSSPIEIIDSVSYNDLNSDISYGRIGTNKNERGYYFSEMSPGEINLSDFVLINEPCFSVSSGFYDEEFELILTADDDCTIYYTLDGSTPNANSIVYSSPIHIYDASIHRNNISMYTEISANEYIGPETNVDKAMVVSAIAIGEMKSSTVKTETYFIGNRMREKYENEFIISLVTDEDNLFSDDKGIYVLGDTYKNWVNSDKYDSETEARWQPANYRKKGKEWERPATLQIFTDFGNTVLQENVGIRIHGGATRVLYQKSFSIYARSEYGNSKIEYEIFPDDLMWDKDNNVTKFDSILLRNTGNDHDVLRLRDKVNQKLFEGRDVSLQAMRPAIVFINGEYWGHYEITEKLSDYYIESHFGIDEDEVCIIKNNSLQDGSESSLREWKDLIAWIKNTDFSVQENYSLIENKIDIQGLIDYISLNVYINNVDWGVNNIAWWKSEHIDSSNKYADGKWRFIVFDTEYSTSLNKNTKVEKDDFRRLLREDCDLFLIFRSLIKNESFKCKFCNSFLDIANYNFILEKVNSLINDIKDTYENYTSDYYLRFYSNKSLDNNYEYSVELLIDFFKNRFGYIVPYMKTDLGLTGDLIQVTIQNDSSLGYLSINTITPEMDEEGTWVGRYYTDFPVHLNVVPASGMSFLYYEVTNDNGYTRIYDVETDLELIGDTTITPIYAPDGEKNYAGMPYTGENGAEYDVTVPHIIINQIYGGKKKESYASHSFIELYNQTDEDVDLTGWSLQYRSSIDGGDDAAWSMVELSGIIPSHCSYLVRCKSIKDPVEGSIVIDDYDLEWDQVINNKGCSVVLVANNKLIPADSAVFDNEIGKPAIYDYVDMVGVSGNDTDDEEVIANEAALFYEGEASPIQSKKNGIRREKLKDTDNNAEKEDFIAVDYSFGNADYIAYISPKCVADGAWEYNKKDVPRYTVTFVEHDDVIKQCEPKKYNTKVDKPDDPERDGYTFAGWFKDEECTKSFDFKTKPVSDITLYAGWTPVDYNITYYNVDGADNSNPISYTIEDEDIILADAVKEGSIFYGWYSDAEFTGEAITTITTSDIENIELYARWKEIITPELVIDGWTYGESSNDPEVSGPVSGAAISFEYKTKGSDDSTYSENVPILAGDYTVKATLSETEEYVFNEVTADFTIARAQLTVKAVDSSKLYSNLDPLFIADILGLQYDDSAADVVYTLYRASGENVGTYSLMPSGDAVQGNYDVVFTEGTFNINAKTVTGPAIVLSVDSFVYDGTEKTPGVTLMDGSTVIDPSEYNVNISNNTAAGTAIVTITDKDGGNYTVSGSKEFIILKAVPTILIAPEAGSLTFGQSLADSAVTGGAVSVAGTFAWDNAEIIPSVANSGVTEYSVVFTPADTDNYDTVKFGVKVSVAKAEPQYTVPTGITAVYGDALADVELPDGWAWADGSLGVGDVGVHSFTAIYTPVDTVNFNNAEAQIEVSVGKDAPVLTIPVAKANLTYTGTAQELVSVSAVSGGAISFAVTYNDGADLAGVPGDDAFSDAIPTGTSAGTYTVWYKVTGDDNHLDTEPASLNVVIGRASAVVYADNSSKAYGEADPALSATVSGLKGSDIQDVLSYSLFRSAGESVGTYNIIAMGDAVQGNYNVSYVQGAFTIETKAVTDPVIILSQDSFVYDGTAKTPSVTVRVGNTIIDPSEYTVTYSNNVEVGTATVTITDKVGGSFEISGSATFTITEPETENQSGDDQGEGQGQDDIQNGNEQDEGQGQDDTQSGNEQGEGQGQDDTQSGTEQGEGQGQDDTQSGTEQGEGQGQDDTQSGTEQGEGQGQDDTQSGTDQGEGQGQGENQSGNEQGEGQGQDDTQSGTEQGEDQGETQSGTEQGNDQNQSGAEQGSQQSSTDNGNSGYAPVIVPSDNTSAVVNDLSNTGSKDSSSNNGTDEKDTEKDTDKVNDIPSVSESVKDVIEIATSELFESITELMTGSTKGSDVVVELKVSKTKITVKKGKTSKIKPKLVTKSADGTTQTVSDVSQFRFMSMSPSIAKVSKNGTVTGRSNGTCTIYVIAQNGMVKQIKVTVK